MRAFTLVFTAAVAALFYSPAHAQDWAAANAGAKFVVQLDLGRFRDTEVGQRLITATQKMAQQELSSSASDVDFMAKMEETLGFNPLEEIKTITVLGGDYERPEKNMQVVVQMGRTSGNLEGLILAAPGYQSKTVGEMTIHSVQPDSNGPQIHAAIVDGSNGNKTLVAATSEADLRRLAESSPGSDGSSMPTGAFVHVQVMELPDQIPTDEPPGHIVKMIENVSLTIGSEDDSFVVVAALSVDDEQRAEQMLQLAQGAKAFVGMFEEEFEGDEEMQMLLPLLDSLEVGRESTTVEIKAMVPEAMVIEFLRNEADLPL